MKRKNGFTLIELLATIVVLGILLGLAGFVTINVIKKAKEKSYQVTINEIEKNANSYLLENTDRLSFVLSDDNTYEYQCITVENLVDYGYLDSNVTNSNIDENNKVGIKDYIYIERDPGSKNITKTLYTRVNGSKYSDLCGAVVLGLGNIIFTSNPGFDEWSKYKDITITYNVKNLNDQRTIIDYSFGHSYNGKFTYDANKDVLNGTTKIKVLRVTSNGVLNADIKLDTNVLAVNSKEIDKIDNVGPVIALGNYTGSATVSNSVTIPLKVTDYGIGVNYSSFTKEDITIKVGNNNVTNYNLTQVSGENYNLVINNNSFGGKIIINIAKDKVFDKLENPNLDIEIDTGITFNNIYTVTYHGNGGTSAQYGDTWSNTVHYGDEYVTPKNWYTRKGYTFNGWNEKADGSGIAWSLTSNGVYENGNGANKWTWTYKNDIDLYAQWKPTTYKITYHGNGGTSSQYGDTWTSASFTYGTKYTKIVENNWYTRTGYCFTGWNTKADGTGDSSWKAGYPNGTATEWKWVNGEYGLSNNKLNLYAQWKKCFIIKYYANNGTNKTWTSEPYYYGEYYTYIIQSNMFTYNGYYFVTWYTTPNGQNGTSWTQGYPYGTAKKWTWDNGDYGISNGVLKLYAQWAQGGGGSSDTGNTGCALCWHVDGSCYCCLD